MNAKERPRHCNIFGHIPFSNASNTLVTILRFLINVNIEPRFQNFKHIKPSLNIFTMQYNEDMLKLLFSQFKPTYEDIRFMACQSHPSK